MDFFAHVEPTMQWFRAFVDEETRAGRGSDKISPLIT